MYVPVHSLYVTKINKPIQFVTISIVVKILQ